MIRPRTPQASPRAGITLTEILIGIMILGVGLVSVATLFPIGLLRLREAQRQSRSALLFESAVADMSARNLVSPGSFRAADYANFGTSYSSDLWYPSSVNAKAPYGSFNPLLQDAPAYTAPFSDPFDTTMPGLDASNTTFYGNSTRGGLPFAYDPLWRFQTKLYPRDVDSSGDLLPEARFGSGIGFVRLDPDGDAPSAHGLQRLTNFNGRSLGTWTDSNGVPHDWCIMQSSSAVPMIFVSPEDVVWNEANNRLNFSPVLPDRTVGLAEADIDQIILGDLRLTTQAPVVDWRYSWLFTGRLASSSNSSGTFEGDLVIYENRPFGLESVPSPLDGSVSIPKPADETVVEAVYGYSRSVRADDSTPSMGYGTAADRTVLLRWPAAMPDPVVKNGDWICDTTYERRQLLANVRFQGVPNVLNGGSYDNLPAQRAFWYQVVKVAPATTDPQLGVDYRSMVVQVNSTLRARTLLAATGTGVGLPVVVNAALIAPHVVNVIPRTIVLH